MNVYPASTLRYVYLHGLASSPKSAKARKLVDRFSAYGIDLLVPDLNQGDFTHLTLTRQIKQVCTLLADSPTVLIGSSLGGLTAAWVAQQQAQVDRLFLLAPAFNFPEHWLTPERERQWSKSGFLDVYHYGEGRVIPLHYGFLADVRRYDLTKLTREIETTILHGIRDEVVPISVSRDYVGTRPWAKLVELDSDHRLTDEIDRIWEEIEPCGTPPSK
ncbi:MAG: alpha/beta fold hydrolase [Cyanobacteria bacterium SID2]|nr:alpha/beta fold hydrolase [Cyanobacteria bacterium SID2]MBP0005722.1 alpha/beta fold hydrolase [Cyanobacteria bacterium SBC]